jgi:hypothetical protein
MNYWDLLPDEIQYDIIKIRENNAATMIQNFWLSRYKFKVEILDRLTEILYPNRTTIYTTHKYDLFIDLFNNNTKKILNLIAKKLNRQTVPQHLVNIYIQILKLFYNELSYYIINYKNTKHSKQLIKIYSNIYNNSHKTIKNILEEIKCKPL